MALHCCHFTTWALYKLHQNFQHRHCNNNEPTPTDHQSNNNNNNNGNNQNNNNNRNMFMVFPYIHGLYEKFKRTCNKKGIQVYFKGSNTFKTLLMASKDKDTKLLKSGVIYQYKCPAINCSEEYIGETGSAFGDRLKEHLRAQSPIHQHTSSTGHPINPGCFNIIHKEAQGTTRHIKEVMYIRANDPSLNRNCCKYQLPHVWHQVLQDTLDLKVKLPYKPSFSHIYHSPLLDTHSPLCYHGGCTTFFLLSISMWGCHITPFHSPFTHLFPYISGAILGKYLIFIYLVQHFF